MLDIPNFKRLKITHLVCDYNGTIAKDGIVLPQIKALFDELSKKYTLHVITADTHGSVVAQLKGYDTNIKILNTLDHTQEKADFISLLGAEQTVAIGNGNNDKEMLALSAIGIALLGDEGCSTASMMASDMVCTNITQALELFLEPKRLVATLRN